MIKKIGHVAIAVADLDAEIARYRDVLGLEFHGTEVVAEQKVKVAFFKVGEVFIELLEPTAPDSPIAQFIEKRGGGIHHLSFIVDDIKAQIVDLQAKGVRMLNEEPRSGAHDTLIAFAHPKSFSGVLLELTEKK